jgi:RNA polymerase sigma factor (sigma-70 family)
VSRCSEVRAREARARRRRDHPRPEQGPGTDRARLARAVDGLSREHRETLVLCYGRGMSQSEAAGVLRVPLGTVKSRMHAAMGRLREALGDEAGGAA